MTKILQKIGMLIVALSCSLSANAYDFEIDGIYYDVISLEDMTCMVVSGEERYSGDINIPAEVTYKNRTFTVTSIKKRCFEECKSLTSVLIPNTVIIINEEAFKGCESLGRVIIGDGVETIGPKAFYECSALSNLIIGSSVETIEDEAFCKCSSLTRIDIPNSVNRIGNRAFAGCRGLTNITIGDGLSSIGKNALAECGSVEKGLNVDFGKNVTSIESGAFRGSSLKSLIIPNTVTTIGYGSFNGCDSLKNVVIDNSVTSIYGEAFSECSALESIDLGTRLKEIGGCAFLQCDSLSSISLPGSLEYVDWGNVNSTVYFFGYCNNLKEIRFDYGESELSVQNFYLSASYTPISGWYKKPLNIERLYIDRKVWIEYSYITLCKVKELTYGPHASEFSCLGGDDVRNLEVLTCYSIEPPLIDAFSNTQYMNIIVRVPSEAIEAYQQADVWKYFWNIEGFEYSGVEEIESDITHKSVIGRFDLNGRAVSEDYQGLVIVRYSDGSFKKILNR